MKTVKHAFLIDDDPVTNLINLQVMEHSKLASRVSTFTDAKSALAKLKEIWESDPEKLPEIIFLDVAMPGMDGWGFLDVFIKFPASMQQKCSIIILTCSIDLFDIKKAKKYGIVKDYITKPLDIKALAMLGSPKHQYFSISQSAVNAI